MTDIIDLVSSSESEVLLSDSDTAEQPARDQAEQQSRAADGEQQRPAAEQRSSAALLEAAAGIAGVSVQLIPLTLRRNPAKLRCHLRRWAHRVRERREQQEAWRALPVAVGGLLRSDADLRQEVRVLKITWAPATAGRLKKGRLELRCTHGRVVWLDGSGCLRSGRGKTAALWTTLQ